MKEGLFHRRKPVEQTYLRRRGGTNLAGDIQTVEGDLSFVRDNFAAHQLQQGGRAAAGKALAIVGLSGVEDCYPAELSIGECRRVELARALVNSPPILPGCPQSCAYGSAGIPG